MAVSAYILTNTDILYLCVHINWDGANHLFQYTETKMEKMMQKKFWLPRLFCPAGLQCPVRLQSMLCKEACLTAHIFPRPDRPYPSQPGTCLSWLPVRGMANLNWSDMLGGLNIQMWLAVYGTGRSRAPCVVAQADVPRGWYWDGICRCLSAWTVATKFPTALATRPAR